MATSLAEIRARLLEQDTRQSGNNNRSQGDNGIFPFWNIPENSTTVLRFLPDGDETNMQPALPVAPPNQGEEIKL